MMEARARLLGALILAASPALAAGCTTPEQPAQYGGQGYVHPQQGPGYAYPQQAPGYGYPQQAPGYGYPQQAPGYGYPQQAPGYGYPQQAPGYPQQVPGYAPPPAAPAPPPQPSAWPFPWWPQGGAIPRSSWGTLRGSPKPPLPTFPNLGVPAPVTPAPKGAAGPADECVDTINRYRATLRLAPLARWTVAEPCASGQAQSDSASGQPHGSFGRCGEMAQNVCPGWRGPAEQVTGPCLQSMWSEGPGADYQAHGHYLNMTSDRYTRVACGYHTTAGGQVWAVQDFQ